MKVTYYQKRRRLRKVDLMVISLAKKGKKEARKEEREMSRRHQAAMGNRKNFPSPTGISRASLYLRMPETLAPFTGRAALRFCPVA